VGSLTSHNPIGLHGLLQGQFSLHYLNYIYIYKYNNSGDAPQNYKPHAIRNTRSLCGRFSECQNGWYTELALSFERVSFLLRLSLRQKGARVATHSAAVRTCMRLCVLPSAHLPRHTIPHRRVRFETPHFEGRVARNVSKPGPNGIKPSGVRALKWIPSAASVPLCSHTATQPHSSTHSGDWSAPRACRRRNPRNQIISPAGNRSSVLQAVE
jgi:hypothetical protein